MRNAWVKAGLTGKSRKEVLVLGGKKGSSNAMIKIYSGRTSKQQKQAEHRLSSPCSWLHTPLTFHPLLLAKMDNSNNNTVIQPSCPCAATIEPLPRSASRTQGTSEVCVSHRSRWHPGLPWQVQASYYRHLQWHSSRPSVPASGVEAHLQVSSPPGSRDQENGSGHGLNVSSEPVTVHRRIVPLRACSWHFFPYDFNLQSGFRTNLLLIYFAT